MECKGDLPQRHREREEKAGILGTETPSQSNTVICSFYAKTSENGLLFGSFFGMKLLTELGEQNC